MNFSTALKQHRTKQALSIRKLATLSGISHMHITYLENGLRTPSMATIKALATALDIDVDIMFQAYVENQRETLNEVE